VGKGFGELVCAVDRLPLIANPTERTVLLNRFVEGEADFNSFDNVDFQPMTVSLYITEDPGTHRNADVFACPPYGDDRNIKSDGCVKILSVKDSSAGPTGFKFSPDGRTTYLSIQHWNNGKMPKFNDSSTDDIIKITGSKFHLGSSGNQRGASTRRLISQRGMRTEKIGAHVGSPSCTAHSINPW